MLAAALAGDEFGAADLLERAAALELADPELIALTSARLHLRSAFPDLRRRAESRIADLASQPGPIGVLAGIEEARALRRLGQIDAAAEALQRVLSRAKELDLGPEGDGGFLSVLVSREVRTLRDDAIKHAGGEPAALDSDPGRTPGVEEVLQILSLISAATDPELVLRAVLRESIGLCRMERGFVIVGDGDGLTVRLAEYADRSAIASPEFEVSPTLIQEVLATRRPAHLADDTAQPPHPAQRSLTDRGIRCVACVPLRTESEREAVLYLDHRRRSRRLDPASLRLLELLASHAAVAIDNLRARQAQQRALETAEEVILRRRLAEATDELRGLTGGSAAVRDLRASLERIVPSDSPVLILGETGAGKELVARMIHAGGPRAAREFVTVNCAGLPETLLENELFGHERGAFTGATESRPGLLELADRGTLFLDEVGDMSPRMQASLLRVLESGEVRRLGGRDAATVDVRVLAATHRDLEDEVRRGTFRPDLYFRLNVLSVRLPPLRERIEDLPELVIALFKRLEPKRVPPRITLEAMQRLVAYAWPGNVRELENLLKRLQVLGVRTIEPGHLPEEMRSGHRAPPGAGSIREAERDAVRRALEAAGGNKSRAAKILGIDRKTLYTKLRQLDLESP